LKNLGFFTNGFKFILSGRDFACYGEKLAEGTLILSGMDHGFCGRGSRQKWLGPVHGDGVGFSRSGWNHHV